MKRVELEALRLDTLPELDPRIGALFERQVAVIAQDCMNRPADAAPRTITLEFKIVPIAEVRGEHIECARVDVSVDCKAKVPTFKSATYPLEVNKAGLKFNRDIPEELDQPSLYPQGHESDE